jgi:hypothetical protein
MWVLTSWGVLALLWICVLGCAFGVAASIILGEFSRAVLPAILTVANAFLIYAVLIIRRQQPQLKKPDPSRSGSAEVG